MSGRLLPCILLLLLFLAAFLALALFLPRVLAPLAAAERLFSLFLALFVATRRIPAEEKSRRLLLLFLPWVGIIAVFTLHSAKKILPKKELPSFEDGLVNALSGISYRGCRLSACRAESVEYFPTGKQMRDRLLEDLAAAEREILLDYYILRPGVFFNAVLAILERKVKSGVDVNLIYDDFGCALSLPRNFKTAMLKRGIKTTVFHPIRAIPLGILNRRDHRKLTVIDRKIAYTGGINLSDEYIGEKIRYGHWKDCAVRLTGEPAERFAALFHGREQTKSSANGDPCVCFGDSARRGMRIGEEIFFQLISTAKERLCLCTPYLAPSEKLLFALKSAALAGVDVKILIPHIPDKKSVFALTRSFARELQDAGVKIREYTAGFLHAKSLTADGAYAMVGSYNLDERSLFFQAECGVVLKSEPLCRDIERDFFSCWETGTALPKAKVQEKITAFFMRLFAPLF